MELVKGLLEKYPTQEEGLVNTDFKSNRQVTKLWKLMHDQFKD